MHGQCESRTCQVSCERAHSRRPSSSTPAVYWKPLDNLHTVLESEVQHGGTGALEMSILLPRDQGSSPTHSVRSQEQDAAMLQPQALCATRFSNLEVHPDWDLEIRLSKRSTRLRIPAKTKRSIITRQQYTCKSFEWAGIQTVARQQRRENEAKKTCNVQQ